MTSAGHRERDAWAAHHADWAAHRADVRTREALRRDKPLALARPRPRHPVAARAQPARAQPLRAAWDPEPAPRRPHRAARRRRIPGGWRVCAVPVLVVLSVLAVVNAARPGAPAAPAGSGPAAPIIGEAPVAAGPDVEVPSAELPPGGEFPVTGAGTWHIVPGSRPQVGTGKLLTYTVEVEDGVSVVDGDAGFARAVDTTLADPRSWIGSGNIALRRIDSGVPDFRVSLSSQLTTRALCGYQIRYDTSCYVPDSGRVVMSAARWVRGAVAFEGQLGLYRQYAVNHEVGHVLGNRHVPCPAQGALAPVMMQQSFGVADDYLAELTDPSPQGVQIPRDGLVCRPNAWPYPQGARGG